MKTGALTPEQLAQFHKDGYLVLPAVFNDDEVRRMQAESDYILELIVNSSLANGRKSGRLDLRELGDGSQTVRKIQPINDLSLFFTQISQDPRLIEPMRQIMGCEPILMEEKLNGKEPLPQPVPELQGVKLDDRFPIHNDWAYYQAQAYPQEILSSAISIDRCTADSGPLHVWPGSHTSHLEHARVDNGLAVKPGLIDPDGGVDILAPAGSVMIFHALLVHNSRPNTSGRPRRLMIYSHYPDSFDMGYPDKRNGPARLREAPWEGEYHRLKAAGRYRDRFKAPAFAGID